MKYSFSNNVMIFFMLLFSTLLIINSTTTTIYGSDIKHPPNTLSIFNIAYDPSNILGIVKDGSLIVAETNETKKLTSISPVEAVTPESGSINLTAYEGIAILVNSPHSNNEWVFGATIVGIGDPIVTKLVKEVYNLE